MYNQFMGQILAAGFQINPKNWAFCAAQQVAIQQNQALFSLLGTVYGGDGVRTFGLPDLRGKYPMGQGNGPGLTPRVMGETAGTQTVTMLQSNLPAHIHLMMVDNTAATAATPQSNSLSQGPSIDSSKVNVYGVVDKIEGTMSPLSVASSGGSQPFSVMQPYNTVNYIIALSGIFPSRN